ncbi:NAD(P)-dependent alcohol dehydrogenase [Arthrobacter sp. UYEF20]|uniref:zinc-dependent alcohol dehydrogenase family protein n=1 Tax=Arthrobacter sp. UYEF20 TaxID=1756363 RepID=UPI003395E0F2
MTTQPAASPTMMYGHVGPMTAWTTQGDGIEKISPRQLPIPTPGPGEVLVKIAALSLNYRDLLVVGGKGGWKPAHRVVPVSDAVGTVVEVGEGTDRFAVGDRVSAIFLPKWQSGPLTRETYVTPTGGPANRGMLAEYVTIDQDEAVSAPRTLDDEHAATLPVAALTAWHAVVRRGRIQPGQTVLIHGTGGVSLFALQFALALGAVPIITSSSDEKIRKLHALGSLKTINYRKTPDVASEVLRLTGGEGVDHVIETIGGENLNHSLGAVKIGGAIAFIGLIAGLAALINTYEFVSKNVTIHGVETGSREMYEEMGAFIDEHSIRPLVDSTYTADKIHEALQHLEDGRHFGKIVISMPPSPLPG